MFKALMKKQLTEMTSFITINKKKGTKNKISSIILLALLFVYMFGMAGALIFKVASDMKVFFDVNMGWLYFTMMGLLATGMGILGSIFLAYSSIYQAKDNEQLIAMPIPPAAILASRILGCYIMTFLFEMIVTIPFYLVYFINFEVSALQILFTVLTIITLPLFAVSLSCVLGWLIALIASRLPKFVKNIFIIIFSIAFIGLYFVFTSNAGDFIKSIISNPDGIASVSKSVFYPVYAFGTGCTGEISKYLVYLGINTVLFAVIYFVLSKTFLSLATINKGSSSKKFIKKELSSSGSEKALLKREFSKLKSSPNYIINCCMGTIFMILLAVMLFFKRDFFDMFPKEIIGELLCVALAFMAGFNDITAPSVSLEGKSIWIIQSLPVSTWNVLRAKLSMHMILTAIPALILTASLEIIFDMTLVSRILMPVIAVVIPFFEAAFGLMLNLKMPNLKWTNETVAVKQGANILIAMFGTMGAIIIFGIVYFLIESFVSLAVYIAVCTAIILIAALFIYKWLKNKGCEIFSHL